MENEDESIILKTLREKDEWCRTWEDFREADSRKSVITTPPLPSDNQELSRIINAAIDRLNRIPSSSNTAATQAAEPDVKLEAEIDRLRDEHETLRDTASHVFYTIRDVIPEEYLNHKELAAALAELEKLI